MHSHSCKISISSGQLFKVWRLRIKLCKATIARDWGTIWSDLLGRVFNMSFESVLCFAFLAHLDALVVVLG